MEKKPGWKRDAEVESLGERMPLEWVAGSAFRFFPARPGELFGYVLHPVDLATNKAAAAADRREPRARQDLKEKRAQNRKLARCRRLSRPPVIRGSAVTDDRFWARGYWRGEKFRNLLEGSMAGSYHRKASGLRRTMQCLLFVAGFSALLPCATWAANLTGTTRDTTGRSIQNAVVVVRFAPSETEAARTRTDALGAYSFSSLSPGDFSLAISAPGFGTATVRDILLNENGKSMLPVTLYVAGGCGSIPVPQYLRPLENPNDAGRISGTIEDHVRNAPIGLAAITLAGQGNVSPTGAGSDATGHYTFLCKAGAYSLHIRQPGYFEDEYRIYHVQAGFETVYFPIFLDPCRPGKCQLALKPSPRCE